MMSYYDFFFVMLLSVIGYLSSIYLSKWIQLYMENNKVLQSINEKTSQFNGKIFSIIKNTFRR